MATLETLASIRTKVRSRTHYESSNFVTDIELNGYVNDSAAELYDILIGAYEGYAVTSVDVPVTSGNSFALPATFYKLVAIDRVVSLPDQFSSLGRVSFGDRNSASGYELRGQTVYLHPYSTAAGQTFRVWFTPVFTQLVSDSDTTDTIANWGEYVIADVCIKVCAKSGEDASVFQGQKQLMTNRVEAMSHSRDENTPQHVQDVIGGPEGSYIGGRWVDD